MQISNNTSSYDLAQTQRATSEPAQPDTDAGQTSPSAVGATGPQAPTPTPASPSAQFDASTLAGLLTLQQQAQQQPPTSGTTSTPPNGAVHPHHHGHHGHKAHAAGQGETASAPTSSTGSDPTTATLGA